MTLKNINHPCTWKGFARMNDQVDRWFSTLLILRCVAGWLARWGILGDENPYILLRLRNTEVDTQIFLLIILVCFYKSQGSSGTNPSSLIVKLGWSFEKTLHGYIMPFFGRVSMDCCSWGTSWLWRSSPTLWQIAMEGPFWTHHRDA